MGTPANQTKGTQHLSRLKASALTKEVSLRSARNSETRVCVRHFSQCPWYLRSLRALMLGTHTRSSRPQASVPSANHHSLSTEDISFIDPILQMGKLRPAITELPRGCHREAWLLYYPTHCPLVGRGSLHTPIISPVGVGDPGSPGSPSKGHQSLSPSNIPASFHDQNTVEMSPHIFPAGHLHLRACRGTEGTSQERKFPLAKHSGLPVSSLPADRWGN